MNFNNFIFKLKYPPIFLFLAIIVIAYFTFADARVVLAVSSIGNAVYLGSFLSGMLFAFAVTAPFGAGFWSVVLPQNIFLAAVCGGLGTALMDVLIFRFIKSVVHIKTAHAHKSKYMPKMERILSHSFPRVVIAGLSFNLTGFLIGLPLPHNLEKVVISSVTRVSAAEVALMSFIVFTITALFFLSLRYTVPFFFGLLGFG